MSRDRRHTWGLIIDILDVLEQHGYHQADDQHTGRAIGLVGDLARIYEGTQEAPAGAYLVPAPQPRQPGPDHPGPDLPASAAARGAETVDGEAGHAANSSPEAIVGAGMHTILSALDEAADTKRDRAECCADCADQTCGLCQYRLDAARSYETLAIRLVRAMEASPPQKPPPQNVVDLAAGRPVQPQAAPEREAGQ